MAHRAKRKLLKDRALAAAILLGCACVLAMVFLLNPARNPLTLCVFRLITGLFCPACGGTRALYELLHLRPLRALAMNGFLVLLMPLIAYVILSELTRMIIGRRVLPLAMPRTGVLVGIIALFLAFGVARNLPIFSFMAPL